MKKFNKRSSMAELCPYTRSVKNRVKTNLTLGIGVIIAFILLSLFLDQKAYPQTLAIGDKLPAINISVINHPKGEMSLANTNKLIIIDFWATWCAPCIASLPKTDSLQRVYNKDVIFLPVTYEPRAKVEKLLTKTKKLSAVSLPIATDEQKLHELFPHKELPHYVWINAEGTVVAITGAQEVNGDNIKKMLTNTSIQLVEKKDKIINYDRNSPLLFGNLGLSKDQIQFESLVSGFIEGLPSRYDVVRNENNIITRITAVNASLEMLYLLAWSNGTQFFGRNRLVYDVKDKLPLITEERDRGFLAKWMREYSRCYELIIPESLTAQVFTKMQADLSSYFPQYKVSVEKKKVKCLALVRTSTVDKLKTSGKPSRTSFSHFEATMTNCSLGLLVAQLTAVYLQDLSTPIVDATGYNGNVDLFLDTNMTNVESLRGALHAYDLDLVVKELEVDMVVVRDGF